MVLSLLWRIQSINLWGLPPPPQTPPNMDTKKRKNNQVESEAEKLSPKDKAPRTDNQNNYDEMNIEITEIIPPKDTSKVHASEKRRDHLDKVLKIIAELTPIGESNEPVTKANFRNVLLMVTILCQFLFDE